MNPIIQEIFHGTPVTKEQSDLLYSKLKPATFKKGEFVLQDGDEVKDIFYVHTGCLRSYLLDKDGKEHTLQFAVKGWWISDYIALYGKKKSPAVSFIECITDASIYSISKSDFDQFIREDPEFSHFHIRKMELAFASFQNRILENLTLSAKQRYLNFVAAYSNIASEVKNYHIASYLGIATESLSRIRRELSND